MFRPAFSVPPAIDEHNQANTASLRLNRYQLLSLALDRMQGLGFSAKRIERGGVACLVLRRVGPN